MDIKQLNTFLTVSNLLNFTKAAEYLGYAQSSITAQIRQLENELDVALFDRIGKKVVLTGSGKRLIPYATQILQLSVDLKNAVSGSEKPEGTLIVGTAESLSIYRLPEVIKEYRRLYPQVDIQLKLLSSGDFFPCLSDGTIDIAFTIGKKSEAKYVQKAVELQESIQVLACPGHPLTEKEHLSPKDFEGESLLLTGPACSYRGAFANRLAEARVVPRVVLETDSIQVIKQAAMSGLGICVLPAVSVIQEIAEGKLLPLKFDTSDYQIFSQLMYHKDRWISPALEEFIRLSILLLPEGQKYDNKVSKPIG